VPATEALSKLTSSFDNMIQAVNSYLGTSSSNAILPTLQSFLQNLLQDLHSGRSIAGAMINTQA
jgi:phage-related minor tail protein